MLINDLKHKTVHMFACKLKKPKSYGNSNLTRKSLETDRIAQVVN